MKKLPIVVIAVILAIVVLFFRDPKSSSDLLSVFSTPIPSATPIPGVLMPYEEGNLRVQWISVDPKNIALFSNLKDKKPSYDLKRENNCNFLVNGGFYSKEDTHLGLLISKGYTESEYRTNTLFNGIFGVTFADEPFLGSTYPKGSTKVAIQSGPLLIKNSESLNLSLKNDEYARRIVVGINQTEVIFMVFYKQGSEFSGPLLSDLPKLVSDFASQNNIAITNALNLDGGSASAFYTPNYSIQELSNIGSYFCINE